MSDTWHGFLNGVCTGALVASICLVVDFCWQKLRRRAATVKPAPVIPYTIYHGLDSIDVVVSVTDLSVKESVSASTDVINNNMIRIYLPRGSFRVTVTGGAHPDHPMIIGKFSIMVETLE